MAWDNLHELLRSLYDEMLPLSADMAAVAKALQVWEPCFMWH